MHLQHLKLVAACSALLAAGFLLHSQLRPADATPPKVWFYDLNTNQLFTRHYQDPPIQAPSGRLPDGKAAGVRAYLFACGSCAKEADRSVAWLETLSEPPASPDQAAPGQRGSADPSLDPLGRKRLIKKPDQEQWLDLASPEGAQVQVLQPCPDGAQPTPCPQP